MKKYILTYPNHGNIQQVKTLIRHKEDYLEVIKPTEARIAEIDNILANLNRKKKPDEYNDLVSEKSKLKRHLSETYGSSWFTDQSPLWESQKRGGEMEIMGYHLPVIISEFH